MDSDEKIKESFENYAQQITIFFKALQRRGFTREEATKLTAVWLKASITAGAKTRKASSEYWTRYGSRLKGSQLEEEVTFVDDADPDVIAARLTEAFKEACEHK